MKEKISNLERIRRINMDLPVTKTLQYIENVNGEIIAKEVKEYRLIQDFYKSGWGVVEVVLEDGTIKKCHSTYFSEMQKTKL